MDEVTQRQNTKTHVNALSATKVGDGLLDTKLVLAWLLTTLGAGAFWIGLLVPIREAGATLPQLFTAQKLRSVAVRKWWWVAGSVVQGLAVFGIAHAAFTQSGDALGLAVVLYLTLFALARSICSVSYKDVLGKTIDKSSRGLVTGTAAAVAAGGVLLFGLILLLGVFERTQVVLTGLGLAGILWLFAAWRFSRLIEEPSVVSVTPSDGMWRQYWQYLRNDTELQKFLVVRGLLTATAVAPPFLLLLAEQSDIAAFGHIGGLVLAAAFATFVSGRVWGRLSDRSTKAVLGWAGVSAAGGLIIALLGGSFGGYEQIWFLPLVLFLLMLSYQGVRIARTVHLVNLANEETRAAYTAISNTIIGIVLLGTGVFGWLASMVGVSFVISILAGMSALGGMLGFLLREN